MRCSGAGWLHHLSAAGRAAYHNQFLFKDISYDPVNGFTPITNLFFMTQVLAVNSSSGSRKFADLASLVEAEAGHAELFVTGPLPNPVCRGVQEEEQRRHCLDSVQGRRRL